MLKQQHYTLTNVKKVKSQSTTPLTEIKCVYGDVNCDKIIDRVDSGDMIYVTMRQNAQFYDVVVCPEVTLLLHT